MNTNVGIATAGVAVTALALGLAAITEARHENPSLAEARETSLRSRARPCGEPTPTRPVGIPAARRGPSGAGD